jgi:hypothetical protein
MLPLRQRTWPQDHSCHAGEPCLGISALSPTHHLLTPTLSSLLTKFALSGILGVGNGKPNERAGEQSGALLARRTRTIRMCSFDARSKEDRTKRRGIQPHVFEIRLLCRVEKLGGLLLASAAARVHGYADFVRRVGA